MIIVIDGPAGSGKSSTAKEIAKRLNLQFLDSGALYRALTVIWIEAGEPDLQSFFKMLNKVDLNTRYINQVFNVSYNGKDITEDIRSQEVASHVSNIAKESAVRAYVNNYMRELVKNGVYIADGRDLGTAVFPEADLKFYMKASLEERAKRRFKEMRQLKTGLTLNDVKLNLQQRDFTDSNRMSDPLKKADDAVVIDTTRKTFEEQIQEMIRIIENKLKL